MTKKISFSLSLEELQALLELCENQLFRMKFIDPKMGHTMRPELRKASESAMEALREAYRKSRGLRELKRA